MTFEKVHAFLTKRSAFQISAICCVLVILVRVLDQWTKFDLAFSIFYLIPVALAAWYLRGAMRLAAAFVLALTWIGGDLITGHWAESVPILLGSAVIRAAFFLTATLIIIRIERLLRVQTSLAQHDPLTGLLNRRGFSERASVLFHLSARLGQPLALGYVDLDAFKALNDAHGHATGDDVLQGVAAALSHDLRASDALGRLGGDEFALLLPNTHYRGATLTFTKVHKNLIARAHRAGWPIGFSIGVIVLTPPFPEVERAVHAADELMYEIKNSGKNDLVIRKWVHGAERDDPPV